MSSPLHLDVTLSYNTFVSSRAKNAGVIMASLTYNKVELMHACWGMYGELLEYLGAESPKNAIEELGDFGFYLQQVENISNFILVDSEEATATDLPAAVTEFCDLAKKYVIYNNEDIQIRLLSSLKQLKLSYIKELELHGLTLEQAQLLNRLKLVKRYPTVYSDAAAAERADKAEGET